MATTTKDVAGSVDSMEVLQMRDGLRRTETHTLLPDPEPRERKYLIFSVDDHFLEPANLYEGRLPSKFADVAPRIVEDEDGVEYWLYEGKMEPNLSSNGTVGRPMEEWTLQALRYDEFRPGVWDPKARIKDMDIDGVWVSLNFPSVGIGFCGQRFMRMKDRDLALACMRAYNDWIIDEWCATAPDRFIPVQVTWLHDPQLAADEIRANAERGFKGLFFSENPSKLGLPSIHTGYWDPVMQACAETDTIIQMQVVALHGVLTRRRTRRG